MKPKPYVDARDVYDFERDPDCPACLRGLRHSELHHNVAVTRGRGGHPGPCDCRECAERKTGGAR